MWPNGSRTVEARLDLRRINQLGVGILRDWLAADSGRERSAGEYYLDRLARDSLLVANEIAIADYFRRYFDAERVHVVEMGTGFGELSVLLALGGFHATAFESDAGRYAGASALLAGLAQQGIDVDRILLRLGTFPPALDLELFDREGTVIFVSTNVTSSYVMEHLAHIHRILRLFDHLVIDLARFGSARDQESIQLLADEFERNGFFEKACIYSASGSDVRHFARQQRSSQSSAVSLSDTGQQPEMPAPFDFEADLRWADRLDRLLVPVLQHQLQRFGSDATAAYNFYTARISNGLLLAEYEIAVAGALLARRHGITHVDEIGSGYGQLVFLLGWNGFQVRGFEADSVRARMAGRLRTVLDIADPDLTRRITLVEGNFPSTADPLPDTMSLVLTTNLVATRTPEQQLETVHAMRGYSCALVDVQRFFNKREDEASQQVVFDLFAEAGFTDSELFLNLGINGRYFLFYNRHPVLGAGQVMGVQSAAHE